MSARAIAIFLATLYLVPYPKLAAAQTVEACYWYDSPAVVSSVEEFVTKARSIAAQDSSADNGRQTFLHAMVPFDGQSLLQQNWFESSIPIYRSELSTAGTCMDGAYPSFEAAVQAAGDRPNRRLILGWHSKTTFFD